MLTTLQPTRQEAGFCRPPTGASSVRRFAPALAAGVALLLTAPGLARAQAQPVPRTETAAVADPGTSRDGGAVDGSPELPESTPSEETAAAPSMNAPGVLAVPADDVPAPAPLATAPYGDPQIDRHEVPGAAPIEIHGFASQGFMLTTGNDYIAGDTTNGSFRMSEVGLNVTKEVADKLRIGVQAFAQNFPPGGTFNLRADWFYVDYRGRDWLGVRFGRLKIPFGLYNDVNDIDSARVPILLPQSTYPIQGRQFLFSQTGFELYGFARSRAAGALEYRLYAGTIYIDPAIFVPPGSPVQLQLDIRYVLGGRLFWETPLEGLRIGASSLAVHMDVNAFVEGMTIPIRNRSLLSIASAELVRGPLSLTAEYALWHTNQESPLAGSNFSGTSERAYAMVTCRVAPWLHPGLYYARYLPDIDNRSGDAASRQNDVALTLRFDVTYNWIVKAEGHLMEGTAGLVSPLTVTPPPMNPESVWGVFLLKATGYF